ncbi:RNA polymerase sigma factor [Paenibacillus glacialis]|uniref:RNA polymerase subunit sigma-70 n=1 Tax=Paenibacillus glacialis TaxID=494026 RepID=A0A168MBL6_9BACL|nr:RNA polymerase sigma factor [Paenibacillus glacialis]OAB44479.1 RNA polymerase subunit sigma-70 [Paenibacillus glacialis]
MTERELFDSYNKDVYRTCYHMLQNAQDAEDVCHDVFITVFRQDWRSVEHIRAWILRIAMNHSLNILRKNRTKREKQEQIQIQHDQATMAIKSVNTIVMEKALATELQKQLNQLPDKLLAVVTLRYVGDLSMVEISESMNIPLGTVKSRLHNALKLMRKNMERHERFLTKGEKQLGIN